MEIISELIRTSQELLLLSSQDNQKINLIDPKTLAPIETYQDDTFPSKFTLQVSNKFGHILAYQATKQILNIWNFNNKKLFLRIHTQEKLTATHISQSELYFVGGSITGNIYVWHTLTGNLIKKFKGSQKKINKIMFSANDGFIIAGGEDGIINVYKTVEVFSQNNELFKDQNRSMVELRPFQQLIGHTERISDMKLGSSQLLYTVSADKTMIVWEFARGAKLAVQSCESSIKCLVVHPSEQWAYLGCQNGKIIQVKLKDGDIFEFQDQDSKNATLKKWKTRVMEGHKSELECMDFFSEQNLLISGSKDGQVMFWNQEGQIYKKYSQYTSAITNLNIITRPREFQAQNSASTQNKFKRVITFKPFSKFERSLQVQQQQQQQQNSEPQTIQQLNNSNNNKDIDRFVVGLNKSQGVTKKIRKKSGSFERGGQVKSFFKAHYRMVNRSREEIQRDPKGGISGGITQSDVLKKIPQSKVIEIYKQNKKLRQKNHKEFCEEFKKSQKSQKSVKAY